MFWLFHHLLLVFQTISTKKLFIAVIRTFSSWIHWEVPKKRAKMSSTDNNNNSNNNLPVTTTSTAAATDPLAATSAAIDFPWTWIAWTRPPSSLSHISQRPQRGPPGSATSLFQCLVRRMVKTIRMLSLHLLRALSTTRTSITCRKIRLKMIEIQVSSTEQKTN